MQLRRPGRFRDSLSILTSTVNVPKSISLKNFPRHQKHRSVYGSTSSTLSSAMVSVGDVQNKVSALREQSISLNDFERWIMSLAWNLHKKVPAGSPVYDLVRDIQGFLIDYRDGESDELELRDELYSLAPESVVGLRSVDANVSVNVTMSFDRDAPPRRIVVAQRSIIRPRRLPRFAIAEL
jgi:hypothetical protein